jgi:hypothetical protein
MMWSTAKELLKSKKFLVAVVACIVWATGKIGWNLSNEELLGAVTPLWTFVIAQGAVDFGKAKQVEAPKP